MGDVGLPLFDDLTQANVLKSGVRVMLLTSAWPMQDWSETLKAHRETLTRLREPAHITQAILKKTDLRDLTEKSKVGVIVGIQDPTCIGDRLNHVQQLFDEGVRVLQVAYQHKNQNGCGFMAENEDTGLTDVGRKFVAAVNEAGIILDLSHLAPQTALGCLEVASGPVMISHTTARGVYDHPRGTTDAVLRRVARLDNTIVGVLAMTFFLDPEDNGLGPLVHHVEHIAKIVGPDRVAIGSDGPVGGFTDLGAAKKMFYEKAQKLLDPKGELTSRWPSHIPEFSDSPNGFRNLEEALSERFNGQEVAGILGGNAWRFFEHALPAV